MLAAAGILFFRDARGAFSTSKSTTRIAGKEA